MGVKAEAAAEEVARSFLAALEERDLASASAMLSDSCLLAFPGATFTSLEEMVEAARGRYKWVKKRVTDTEVMAAASGVDDGLPEEAVAVVYIRGTLYGENRAGKPFEGIRFIDRFEIEDGKIRRQDVWNDLAESGVLAGA